MTDSSATNDVPALVAHAFRRWHSKLMGALVRIIGAHQLDVAEDAVQDAMLAALQHWPFRGVPAEPDAWLYQVARRKLLDRLSRARTAERHAPAIEIGQVLNTQAFATDVDVRDAAMQAFLHSELGQTAAATACTRLALKRVRTLADRALLLERALELEG